MKIYLGLTLYLSGVFMYFFIKELTGNKLAAFASAIFYTFAPYHLIDVHFRATLGESTIFLLVPLLFLFITKYSKENKFIYLTFTTLFTSLIFLAHPLLASVFFGIAIFYILFINLKNKNKKPMLFQLLSLFGGVIVSIYTWSSFIIYAPYMFKAAESTVNISSQFYPFAEIIFSPWRYGLLFQGPKGELALIIGYAQVFVLIISIIMIILKKISKKIQANYIFWVSLCIFFILLMHPLSIFIWNHLNYQFFNMIIPYGRLSLAISFCISIIAGYFVLSFSNSKIKNKFIYILLIITIGSTILNWGQRRVIPEINDSTLRKNVWNSSISDGPTYFIDTKWADKNNLWFSKKPSVPLEITKGKATVTQIKRTSTQHSYIVDAKTAIAIQENTLYFPGWSLKSNNKNIDIYPGKRGVIIGKLPQGKQEVELIYSDITVYAITKIISLVSFLGLLCTIIFYSLRNVLHKRLRILLRLSSSLSS
jgi:hypothetical protein